VKEKEVYLTESERGKLNTS